MRFALFIVVAIAIGACANRPGQPQNEPAYSVQEIDGQQSLVVADKPGLQIVRVDRRSKTIHVYIGGSWISTNTKMKSLATSRGANNTVHIPGGDQVYVRVDLPSLSDSVTETYFFDPDWNPCLPNAGCGGAFDILGASLFHLRADSLGWQCPDDQAPARPLSEAICDRSCESDCVSVTVDIR